MLRGLRAYEANDWDTTRWAFDEALAILQRADLPESYKDLKLIQVGLPPAYRHFDLVAIHNQVQGFPMEQADHHGGSKLVAEEPTESPAFRQAFPTNEESDEDPATLSESAFLEREIIRLMAEFGEDSYTVPPVFVQSVHRIIADYQGPSRKFFTKALARSAKYVPLITTIFKQKKVPEDMAY
ncbi:MAG: hypothetical protein ACE5KY_06190, partial [Candidatus Tectimicrobiota bacterium]